MKHTSPMSQIGERLLALRLERDRLEAATVARALGITPSALSQWETGVVKNLRPENLLKAARFFDVSLPWLITGLGPRKVEEAQTESEADMLRAFRRLGASGQAVALSHVQWMASREGGGDAAGDGPNPNRHLN